MSRVICLFALAVVLATAVIPTLGFVVVALVAIDFVRVEPDLCGPRSDPNTSTFHVARLALVTSRHLPRASLANALQ